MKERNGLFGRWKNATITGTKISPLCLPRGCPCYTPASQQFTWERGCRLLMRTWSLVSSWHCKASFPPPLSVITDHNMFCRLLLPLFQCHRVGRVKADILHLLVLSSCSLAADFILFLYLVVYLANVLAFQWHRSNQTFIKWLMQSCVLCWLFVQWVLFPPCRLHSPTSSHPVHCIFPWKPCRRRAVVGICQH